jgi:hypothetical protein
VRLCPAARCQDALAADQQAGDREHLGCVITSVSTSCSSPIAAAVPAGHNPRGIGPYLATIDPAAEVSPTRGVPSLRSPPRTLPLQPGGCHPATGGCGRTGPPLRELGPQSRRECGQGDSGSAGCSSEHVDTAALTARRSHAA